MASIKQQAVSGMIWASFGSVGGGILNLLVMFVLARLLEPSDFGVLELLVVITSLSTVLVDSGFSQALIRDKNATDLDKSTVFFVNLMISGVLYIVLFLMAPLLASFFRMPEFSLYSRVAFLCIVFDSLSVIQNVNYTKELNFRPIAASILFAIIIAGILAITLSLVGAGTWALVAFIIVNSLLKSIFLWSQSDWHPTLCFSGKSLQNYWRFGSFILIQSIIDKLSMDVESLLIGRSYTKAQLGFFSQSRKINSYFGQALTSVIVKVSYPLLVKIGDSDEQLKQGYRKIVGYTTYITAPLMAFLFCFPYDTMAALFGERWIQAGEFLRLWSCFGLIQPIQAVCNNIFLVKGKSKTMFYIFTIRNLSKIIIVFILISYSIYHMLVGIVLVTLLASIVVFYFSGKLINYKLHTIAKDIIPNIGMALASCLMIYYFSEVYEVCLITPFVKASILFISSILLYVMLGILSHNNNLHEIVQLAKSYLHKK